MELSACHRRGVKQIVTIHVTILKKQITAKVRKLFCETESDYVKRLIALFVRTHLGEKDTFWKPLHKCMKKLLALEKYMLTDDEIWDCIIPIGYAHLCEAEKAIQSHAGTFDFPLPELYDEALCGARLYRQIVLRFEKKTSDEILLKRA